MCTPPSVCRVQTVTVQTAQSKKFLATQKYPVNSINALQGFKKNACFHRKWALYSWTDTFTSGRTHLQAEAGMAGGGNELIERQSEVYIECLTTGCQVHCRQSMMQSISPPASGLKECTRTVQHIMS